VVGEEVMRRLKRSVSVFVTLALVGLFLLSLIGCGADVKAENEKLKAENTNLKSDNDKLETEIQKLNEELSKTAAKVSEKDSTIASLTAENEGLKKEIGDLKTYRKPTKRKNRTQGIK